MTAFPQLRTLRWTSLLLAALAAVLVLPSPAPAAEEDGTEPLPPTRLELWIKDGDGPTTEKASIPLAEEGTFAVRFVIDDREIPGVLHRGDDVRMRWQLVVSGDVGSSGEADAGYVVTLRPVLHTFVDGSDNLAEMRTSWEKSLDVERSEVVEIEIPTSPGGTVVIPSEDMEWGELPEGVDVVHDGDGLALRLGELIAAHDLSLVLRLGPEG